MQPASQAPPPPPAPASTSKFTSHATRLIVWGVCSVALALLPPLLQGLDAALISPTSGVIGGTMSPAIAFLRASSEKGELFLISCALTGAIVGEMYGIKYKALDRYKTLVGVFSFLIFATCVFFFPKAAQIVNFSPWFAVQMLAASIVVAGAGIVLASIDREQPNV